MSDFFWTPHSGYHWQGTSQRFFEGWYFRLTLPEAQESFAFMYSIDDPGGHSPLSSGAAQILGPEERYLYCPLPDIKQFWAWPHRLGLGHWDQVTETTLSPRYLTADNFEAVITQGYQAMATHHQGRLTDSETGAIAQWNYTVQPIYGWGNPQATSVATAGWLSYLPIFEPGWQVLMAHGLATGWAEWQGQRYEFQEAPAYAEKNWGGAFPERWFWIQANAFAAMPDLTVTAVGGRRQVWGRPEVVGLIGIHFAGQYIALNSLRAAFRWQVATWGCWQMTAQDHRYRVVLHGIAKTAPVQVRVPMLEGLRFECWDTTHGMLRVEVWQRSHLNSGAETCLLQADTTLAGLEVGGQGWEQPWHYSTSY